jgi:hypothetical protein
MLPVADINLQTFLEKADLDDRARSFIRPFFGCLTAALCYLHDNRIRHKDIKPSNVLIKHDQVYLTDFGTSLDWSGHDNSTTATAPPTTPRYCAPEVMSCIERNTSSDIWSLGCVFLEMWTVLRQHTLEDLRTYMSAHGTQVKEYHSNPDGFTGWIKVLERVAGPSCDRVPSNWISNMLQRQPALRWNCHILEDRIREASTDLTAEHVFSGLCCLEPDEDTTTDTGFSSDSKTEIDDQDIQALPSPATIEPFEVTPSTPVLILSGMHSEDMVTRKPKKKPAPSPFFRWAAGSGTARKESVDRENAHTDGVPIPRVVISDYNAPLQPRVEDENESLSREIQEPSVTPPSANEAEPASIDEDEVASPPQEEDIPSSLGEESWISGFPCMICRSGLDTVADTVELPCHHWIHTTCFSRGYPHYSGHCTTCSIANQKPPKQANRGFAGPHRSRSHQQSVESRTKDAEGRANVFTAWQKMKQLLGERVEDESQRTDLERRSLSPNPAITEPNLKNMGSGRTAKPLQTKARTKSKRHTTVSDRELRPERPVSSRHKPKSSILDVESGSSAEEEARVMREARRNERARAAVTEDVNLSHYYDISSSEEQASSIQKVPRNERARAPFIEDIDERYYYYPPPVTIKMGPPWPRFGRKLGVDRVGSWLSDVQIDPEAINTAVSDVEVDDWRQVATTNELLLKAQSGYRTPPMNQSPSWSEHESETGHSRDQQRSASVEAQTGCNPHSRDAMEYDPNLRGSGTESPQDRPESYRTKSEGIPSNSGGTNRYYYPASGSEPIKLPHRTVLREPRTRTRRAGREKVRVHQESSTPIPNIDKPRRRGRQPSYDPEDVQYNRRRQPSYDPEEVQYSRKYGPEDIRWAPRSGEERGYASKPTLGRTATYVY